MTHIGNSCYAVSVTVMIWEYVKYIWKNRVSQLYTSIGAEKVFQQVKHIWRYISVSKWAYYVNHSTTVLETCEYILLGSHFPIPVLFFLSYVWYFILYGVTPVFLIGVVWYSEYAKFLYITFNIFMWTLNQ